MKTIGQGRPDWTPWWIGTRVQCYECGVEVELEKGDECLALFCGQAASVEIGIACHRCGTVTHIRKPANATHDGRRIRRTVDGIVGNLNRGE